MENKKNKKQFEVLIVEDDPREETFPKRVLRKIKRYGCYKESNGKEIYPLEDLDFYSWREQQIEVTSKNLYEDLKNILKKEIEKIEKTINEKQKKVLEKLMEEGFDQLYLEYSKGDCGETPLFLPNVEKKLKEEGYDVNIVWLYPKNDLETINYLKENWNNLEVIVLDMGFNCEGHDFKKMKDQLKAKKTESFQITVDFDGKRITEDPEYFTFPSPPLYEDRWLLESLKHAGGIYVGEFLRQNNKKFTLYTDNPRHAFLNESFAYVMGLLSKEEIKKVNEEFYSIWSRSREKINGMRIGKSESGNFCMGFKSYNYIKSVKELSDVIKAAIEYQREE